MVDEHQTVRNCNFNDVIERLPVLLQYHTPDRVDKDREVIRGAPTFVSAEPSNQQLVIVEILLCLLHVWIIRTLNAFIFYDTEVMFQRSYYTAGCTAVLHCYVHCWQHWHSCYM